MVELRGHQQYLVKVHGSGRLTLRNRAFLRKTTPYGVWTDGWDSNQGVDKGTQEVEAPDRLSVPVPPAPDAGCPGMAEDDGLQEAGGPGDAGPPVEDEAHPVQGEPRRSGRARRAPERLEVQWNAKSYTTPSVQSVVTSFSSGLKGGGGI